jgi:DNA-directed RNA polymerase specialized sigma24 family protein
VVASADLSRELGIPPSTVRVYRRRALERLRREIEKLERVDRPAEAEVAM